MNIKFVKLSKNQFAIVDAEDFEYVSRFNWYYSCNAARGYGYAVRRVNQRGLSMHRVLINAQPNQIVDHINQDTLDNRKSNLRTCTHSQNGANRKKQKTKCSSKFKGVSWITSRQKWQASIQYKGRPKFIGYFTTEALAAEAYNKEAKLLFGEFAYG